MQTFFYCASVYRISQIFCCFKNWMFVATLHWVSLLVPFSNSICSLDVSVSHFGNSCNITNFYIIVIVTCDEWFFFLHYYYNWGLFFVFLRYVHCLFLFCFFFFLIYFLPHHGVCGILVPWSEVQPSSPALETWSLNHREVPRMYSVFKKT